MPNEITLMILQFVLPDDIESFTSTCRKIYNLAAEELETHRSLKRKHAVYRFCNPREPSPSPSPSQLLDDILQEPRTAFYVRELSIDNWWSRWSTQEDLNTVPLEESHLPYSEESMSRLREAVSRFIPDDEARFWIKGIESGSEDPIISMLLLLLPNISTLMFEGQGHSHTFLHHTLYVHARRTKGPGVPLSHLHYVEVPDWGAAGLRLLGLLSALPSMIYDVNTDVHPDTDMVPWTKDSKDMTLTTSMIKPKHLYDFLKAFRRLRSFTYDSDGRKIPNTTKLVSHPLCHRRTPDDVRFTFSPFDQRYMLSSFTRSSLESLTLLSHKRNRDYIGSIGSFENLRTLHVETQLLLHKDLLHDETSLMNALPPKIENLKLECSGIDDERTIARQIATLARLKTEYLPAMREVEVFTRNGVEDFNASEGDTLPTDHAHDCDCLGALWYHDCEHLVQACRTQGFDLRVKAFDVDVVKALDGDN
ncbi:hypothetical protein IMSHALPRED_001031 [Imshaugia aleurites]|uniref:F-box domain-containing protein n=1 Tax=Imshaugia aleurites TaxID=172621 RepID=A0A8H3J0V9_9LECA|nr:hypothetical protein IMSHALPRED_001031 [Imshaugia aleurites]